MSELTLKEHPLMHSVAPEEKEIVADLSVADDIHPVSFFCGSRGCKRVFRVTPFKRREVDGVCDERGIKMKEYVQL
jgi:hypothetical protein